MVSTMTILMAVLSVAAVSAAGPYGLARTPPRGWRSWNAYGPGISQAKMEATMAAMARPFRDGKSILDFGYVHCGLDDNWQACGTGFNQSFHDKNGNPLINTTRFPDMAAMVQYGHARGIKVGWYINNCICAENQFRYTPGGPAFGELVYKQTVAALTQQYQFDGVKIDSCSEWLNMTHWSRLTNASGRPIMHVKILQNTFFRLSARAGIAPHTAMVRILNPAGGSAIL